MGDGVKKKLIRQGRHLFCTFGGCCLCYVKLMTVALNGSSVRSAAATWTSLHKTQLVLIYRTVISTLPARQKDDNHTDT